MFESLQPGILLNKRYKIIESLGQGAFGHTYIVEDTHLPSNPSCVAKQLKPKNLQPEPLEKAKELFNREAEALEKLGKHSKIPGLLAHFEERGEFYLIEEYIKGKTLAEELREQPPQSEKQVISIVSELLEILTFIHQNNIIHRDITPRNIICRQQDRKLVLIDFGAVKEIVTLENQSTRIYTPNHSTLENSGTQIGTPGYADTEQFQGRPSICSDIYAVGVIGIQALIGIETLRKKNPNLFSKDGSFKDEIIWQEEASVSSKFAAILTKMVRKNKGDRYTTADEVLKEIQVIPPPLKPSVIRLLKKLLLPSLTIVAAIPVFFWLKPIITKPSGTNLPLNGKAIASNLDSNNVCQDMLLEQDIYCQEYTFTGEENREVTIEMNSNDFDPFLVLRKPDGNKLEDNGDRSINNWNAQIKATLPSGGKYTVITRTTSPGESGNYTIRATIK